jgi:hypothetical protein
VRAIVTGRLRFAGVLLAAAAIAALPAPGAAALYPGYGDTGFGFTNRGECCEEAIFLAQDDSAAACERIGGYADFRRSAARGRCQTQRKRGYDGQTVFRCTATASVQCR